MKSVVGRADNGLGRPQHGLAGTCGPEGDAGFPGGADVPRPGLDVDHLPAKGMNESGKQLVVCRTLSNSRHRTLCVWKGPARYFNIAGTGVTYRNAARYYRYPSPLAHNIGNHVVFWRGIDVEELG
jgi:hypothetical protein